MTNFNSFRRDFLRMTGPGLAAAAVPAFTAIGASAQEAASAASGYFDVRKYGAIGDGKALDTDAVNRAIDAAAAAGGGVVVFPAGSYLCFSIHLKSFVHLLLLQGSTIVAADSPLPGEQTGYHGGTTMRPNPRLSGTPTRTTDTITGTTRCFGAKTFTTSASPEPGLIWGKGLSNGAGRKGDGAPFVAEQAGVGNKAIALKNCRNVIMRDFSILKAGHFGLLLTGVDNLTIDNLKIDTDRDGMDIDCCQNVRVSNCTVNSPWDDGICPKSSYALGYARPTRNLTITNCYVTGCYELGSLLDGTWKKFAPEDRCRAPAASSAAPNRTAASSMSPSPTASSRDAPVMRWSPKTAPFSKISPSQTRPCGTSFQDPYSCVSAPGARPQGKHKSRHVKRILISNLECYNAPIKISSILSGIPGYAIEDVKLSNIYVETVGGAAAEAATHPAARVREQVPRPRNVRPDAGIWFLPTPHAQPRDEPRRDCVRRT